MVKQNKAVFLDRDGVINKEKGYYIQTIHEFEINEGVKTFLKNVKAKGYLVILITNQGGIGKGMYKKQDVDAIHEHLRKELAKENIAIDEIYYCPHHPVSGNCLCRKPGSLMIEKALARFNIDTEASFLVGDSDRDILAAQKAGIKAFKIPANDNLMDHEKMFFRQNNDDG